MIDWIRGGGILDGGVRASSRSKNNLIKQLINCASTNVLFNNLKLSKIILISNTSIVLLRLEIYYVDI